MTTTIALLLAQDGLTNGLLYALLALSILIVFLVTKVLWISAGDFVVFGALTMGLLSTGQLPGTVWLLMATGVAATLSHSWRCFKAGQWRGWCRFTALAIGYPVLAWLVVRWLVGALVPLPAAVRVLATLALVAPMGPLVYAAVFRPLVSASILTKLIVAVALHTVLVGAGLLVYGPEGLRSPPLISGRIDVGVTRLSLSLMLVLVISAILMVILWAASEKTLWGKAMRATAMNRLGARLVGVHTESSGLIAFAVAGVVGALSGILIGPITTMYYDSGFSIGLKGFIGVVFGGMLSFPGAVLGALLVGLLDSFASFFASTLRDVIVFALLIPILLWRSIGARTHEVGEE